MGDPEKFLHAPGFEGQVFVFFQSQKAGSMFRSVEEDGGDNRLVKFERYRLYSFPEIFLIIFGKEKSMRPAMKEKRTDHVRVGRWT